MVAALVESSRPMSGLEGLRPLPALSFDAMLNLIESDMLLGVRAAQGYRINPACEPSPAMIEYFHAVLSGGSTGKSVKDWRCVMNKRIGISYKERRTALVWLDDKLEQVSITASFFNGRELHLPIYAHAAKGDVGAVDDLCDVVRKRAATGEPLVVKPRHGSNSKHVFLWARPQEVGEDVIVDSVGLALNSYDKSWDKESWNQNAVPKGAVLQPLYAPLSDFMDGEGPVADPTAFSRGVCPKYLRPLELKVQVLFGEVVGGQLNTHPQFLWVSREGEVHIWDQTAEGFLTRHDRLPEEMPPDLVLVLRRALHEHWQVVRRDSESLARAAGVDELRVDWLLGDAKWGPRIGELTYFGTFAIEVIPVSIRLARAFANAHLLHCGQTVVHACF